MAGSVFSATPLRSPESSSPRSARWRSSRWLAADLLGMFTNPYAGLVIYIAVPALFVLGLLLIPLGIWLHRRALRRDPSTPVDWPVIDLGGRACAPS